MNAYHFGGWALIISEVLSLVGLLWFNLLGEPGSVLLTVIWLVGSVLFIIGLPSIQATQPQTGLFGRVGLFLMAIGALIALIITAMSQLGGVIVEETIPTISALFGLIGSVIVGWLTIRAHVFPAWVGWLLIIGTLCNVTSSVFPSGGTILVVIGTLANAAALFGYGVKVIQKSVPHLQSV